MSTTAVNEEDLPQTDQPQEDNGNHYQATTPYFTIAILIGIVVVFLSQMTLSIDAVRAIAGLEKELVTEGEVWRFLSASVIHDGLMHILFNGYALYVLGRLIETISNRYAVSVVFLLAAVCGGVLSYAFFPFGNSVGASGGVMGLLGFLTVYSFKRRKLVSNSLLKNMLFNIGFITIMGFVIPNIDNFGHLGGLIAGVIFGWFQIPVDLYKDPREAGTALRFAGIISLVIILLTAAATAVGLLWVKYLMNSPSIGFVL